MDADIERVLLDRETIRRRVQELGREIAQVYGNPGENRLDERAGVTLLPILSGSIIFLADLIRELPLMMKLAFVHISSYPGRSTESQPHRTLLELTGDVAGRHVLIVDDILDSGRTLPIVQDAVRQRGPASLRTCVLLRKRGKAPAKLKVDFVGFEIDDLFVVGYGLDFDDLYRNYPHIGVLRAELMS
ncbi:MAG: hypoxanthine phosphoribosyltransferase [Phycisphaerae bacterium]|nr:hypoxanthine phosphoribosyltransferase [Phycisphaerae bacterium]MCZ2398636.1 hypoxanthine phosphoribosyltransferase [Phycisphaerae bacterium]NUQ48511.1 hypoxanthine phosphoribosyltransferase [Phycisphaerae bacterium]